MTLERWRDVRVCNHCWALLHAWPTPTVTIPPGDTCELCERNPAFISKRMSETEVASIREWVALPNATSERHDHVGYYKPRGWAAIDYAFVTLGGAICMVKVMTPDVDPLVLVLGMVLVLASVIRALLPARG